ncbi:MAG: hypothetical protein JNL90_06445 [Planctomycetes bacterium]|nr:hypothetical protein [Planctomycetota bacterium]
MSLLPAFVVALSVAANAVACDPAAAAQEAAAPNWRALTLVQGRSSAATTFVAREDGAVLAKGDCPDKESWTLELSGLPPKVTALRLEVLRDPSLQSGGPGRVHGNFVLSELAAAIGPKGSKRPRALALGKASASWSQEGFAALGAVDGLPNTGWAVAPKFDASHHLVVELAKEASAGAGDSLTLELRFDHGDRHVAGCLRVSATDAPPPVRAEQPADERSWGDVQSRINGAIDRGASWLLSEQLLDGSFDIDQTGYRNGGTSLVLYALLKSGVPKGDPAVVRALEWLKCAKPTETYTLGCQLMALHALRDPTVDAWMRELLEALLRNQLPNGSFAYKPGAGADLSNTQYGVLGLRAAAQHGIKVAPEAWEKAAQYVLSVVDDAGGGAYAPLGFRYAPGSAATGSMTSAGASILAICDEQLRGKSKLGGLIASARRGAEWLGQNFIVDGNPRGDGAWTYYYLYGVERLGALLQQEEFGGHRWYREGARWLIDKQEGSGAWPPLGAGALGSTAWALLFLTRATAASTGGSTRALSTFGGDDPTQPISVRASGDAPLTFWISSWGEAERVHYEWPGEEGRGLRVKSVEWHAVGLPGEEESSAIARVEKDGGQPCGHERFGGQFSFPLPGDYSLFARVTLNAPPAGAPADAAAGGSAAAPGAAGEEVVLESSLLAVTVRGVLDPVLFGYSSDPRKNLLALQKPNAVASSRHDEWWDGSRALDGLVARGWSCNDSDRAPRLTIELEKPVRANVLLLTPIRLDTARPWPAKVKVTVNGKGAPIEFSGEVPSGARPLRKWRVPLGAAQVVRRLEIEIVEFAPPAPERTGCGFAEVELQVDATVKK